MWWICYFISVIGIITIIHVLTKTSFEKSKRMLDNFHLWSIIFLITACISVIKLSYKKAQIDALKGKWKYDVKIEDRYINNQHIGSDTIFYKIKSK